MKTYELIGKITDRINQYGLINDDYGSPYGPCDIFGHTMMVLSPDRFKDNPFGFDYRLMAKAQKENEETIMAFCEVMCSSAVELGYLNEVPKKNPHLSLLALTEKHGKDAVENCVALSYCRAKQFEAK